LEISIGFQGLIRNLNPNEETLETPFMENESHFFEVLLVYRLILHEMSLKYKSLKE